MSKIFGKLKVADFLLLELSVLVYSLSTVAANMAAKYEFLSLGYILFFGLEFVVLAIYAVLWQQIIKKFQLSIAYANKSVVLLWTMLWNYLIFAQGITAGKIAGVLLVMAGAVAMNVGGAGE
ncbi:MAG: transporter [Butyrivibrio sp.]|uniref:transporter n=1 Tax=Butyrivibrio sp. TaxID=28121 RepID=UPI001B6662DC|nr:transporter [Butyrivibrio sp.]MBP3784341.1 transporter [Butyrivibrio sp.]